MKLTVSLLIALVLFTGCAPLTHPMPPVKLINEDPARLGQIPPEPIP